MEYAGFWRRLVAYTLDIVPITGVVSLVAYRLFGYDVVLERYLARAPGDLDARWEFLVARNRIRDASLVLYLVYCGVMEASSLRGTLGKWAMGVEVLNTDGTPLSRAEAFRRSGAKAVSLLACGLGCVWVAWSRRKQGWHDTMAGTVVVRRAGRVFPTEPTVAAKW
jgi:uncharacterized RDD family membrane protein YckC